MMWEKVKLGDIATSIQPGPFGSQLHNSDYSESGTPLIMPKDMINGHISHGNLIYVGNEHVSRLSRHQVHEGNIIVARKGDVRKCVYITENEDGWMTGSDCLKVDLNDAVCFPKFIYYQLRSPYIGRWLEKISIGATMPSLNTGLLSGIELVLPPIPTQKRITEILSAYDNLIENNQKQIKLLEESAQRLYKEWFIDLRFPGHENTPVHDGLPEGWRIGTLDEIAVDSGKTEKKENRETYSYYLPIDCLPKESLAYTVTNDISLAESSLISFVPGDILFGAMRPYFHKVVVARDCGLTRSTCFVINAKDDTLWSYLTMLLFSKETIDYATKISVGTTMPYVRWKDFQKMIILIPSNNISINFNEIIKSVIERINYITNSTIKANQLRDYLLPQLMNCK